MDYFKRINKSKIAPEFLKKCEQLLINCQARGAVYYAISGFRDPLEQEALYKIGREPNDTRKVVTNARPFKSAHQYGLAIDFAADLDAKREGLQPDWNIKSYEILAEEARKLGLMPGMDFKTFKEGPHIQSHTSYNWSQLELIYKTQGIEAVWRLLKV
jgi:LAS superfamily LD-carboxypeptidase LdcB